MAYNKSKYVEAAQKLLNQGKVTQAIAEYQQILKYEPRDQVTLMTIGELYIRQGETFQAIEYFERLAQLFVSDGFLTKAIAVYKRIAKLAPEEIRPLEKLADLYVQQGVMSEARPLFLQLAELHLKNNKQADAVALLKKLLLAEPDNLRIQIRLADLYQAMGQPAEALECYVSAAQRALARGDHAECEKLSDKALHIDAKNLNAMIVKARAFSSTGNATQAAEILEKVPDLEKGGEPAELLLDLYLKNAKWDESTALALKIHAADEKNFTATQKVTEALLESGQGERAMAVLSRIRIPMIDAGEHENVVHLLTELATRLPERLEPLEWLVDTYGRTSDSFRLPDALAQLGDTLVKQGKLERAKEVFEQLLDREPESDSAKRKLNDVLRKMGLVAGASHSEAAQASLPADSLQAELPQPEAPKVRPGLNEPATPVAAKETGSTPTAPDLDEETQKFIAQSLTDVDLFASYGLTQKAIGLLEAILRRAPMHAPTLEKLLDFVLGAGDDRRTAELAAQLEHIHGTRGDTRSAERFGELRRRFQRAAGLTDEEIGAAVTAALPQAVETLPAGEEVAVEAEPEEFAVEANAAATPVLEEMPVAGAADAVAEPSIPAPESVEELPIIEISEQAAEPPAAEAVPEEVDLSSEWASLLEDTKQPLPELADGPTADAAPAEPDVPEFAVEEQALIEAAIKLEPDSGDIPTRHEIIEEEEFAVPSDEAGVPGPADSVAGVPEQSGIGEEEFASSGTLLPDEELTALPVPEHSEIAAEGPEPALELPQSGVPEAAPEQAEIELEQASEEIAPSGVDEALELPQPTVPKAAPEQPEIEVDQDFELVLEPEEVTPAHEMSAENFEQQPASATNEISDEHEIPEAQTPSGGEAKRAAGKQAFTTDEFLSDLAKDIGEMGMGELILPEKHAAPAEEPAGARNQGSGVESGPLKEVFEEFRAELGEMGAEDEDLETHYNLGIAFREMGLLEEAIGEFQKVAQASDRGRAFRYAMQCCTLLGLAFMEKGQPSIAAIWYDRALQTPGIDGESKLALRYDLGVAQESAGDLDAALKSFSQVYAVNIDYRDVAERIGSLHKPAR